MSQADDYIAAKDAWEREHPGEVYTTAMHYSSGPTARVLTDYWTQYDKISTFPSFVAPSQPQA